MHERADSPRDVPSMGIFKDRLTARIVAIGAISAILVAAFAIGESSVKRDAGSDRVTVIYWEKWTGDEAEQMRKVVDKFNKSQDRIFVKYLSISGVAQKTMLATAGGTPPDVSGIWQDQLCQFADANALMDLTDLARESGLNRDYYIHGYWDALNYRGRLWALPSTPASVALHVNPDLVPKEYATAETFPKTIEDLDELTKTASKKKADGSLEMAIFLPSNPGWWTWSWPGYFGGELVKDNRVVIDTPEALRSLTWYESYTKEFGSKEVQTFQSGFANFASPKDPFMDGRVATEINGVWKANYIRIYKPDLKWFAVPFPYPKDRPDLAGHSNLSQDILAIPRGAKHAKEAFEFIRFVQRQDVMEGLCTGHGKNSPLNKVSDHFFDNHPNKYIRLFDQLSRSPRSFSSPSIGIFPQMSNEINVAYQQVSTGQKSPKDALKDTQARLDVIWSTYQKQILADQAGDKP
jgi:ABC-type glycerol-3-phosphate transport system substrate-binding protein